MKILHVDEVIAAQNKMYLHGLINHLMLKIKINDWQGLIVGDDC